MLSKEGCLTHYQLQIGFIWTLHYSTNLQTDSVHGRNLILKKKEKLCPIVTRFRRTKKTTAQTNHQKRKSLKSLATLVAKTGIRKL